MSTTPAFLNHGVIGMVHLEALPGTPKYKGDLGHIVAKAVAEAQLYKECGVDAVIVENMGDGPFAVKMDPAQTVALTVATDRVRHAVKIPVGVDAAFCDY